MSSRNCKPPVYIYHEVQDSALCGVHAINNLLQCPMFTPLSMGAIAEELDKKERELLGGGFHESSNVSISGDFSIQVLNTALQNYNNSELVPWFADAADPLDMDGFIVNRSQHWFALRKVGDRWWNLNSTTEKPELVSPFYLSAFLSGLRAEGYSVFYVNGALPSMTNSLNYSNGGDTNLCHWYKEAELLGDTRSDFDQGAGSDKAPPKLVPFSGVGRRLKDEPVGADRRDSDANGGTNGLLGTLQGLTQQDEELQLAQAIRASLGIESAGPAKEGHAATSSSSSTITDTPLNVPVAAGATTAAERRAQRLAALERRGL